MNRRSFRLRVLAQTLPFLLMAPGLVLAQTPPTRGQATAALNQPAKPGAAQYTRQQIDQIVAPIALYPDKLLSQVLMAATYPDQVVAAAQWVQDPSHKDLKGDELVSALEPMPWDPSVKALAAFPQIIVMMSEHIEWTEALGVAFATQQAEVMARVQALRHLAMKSGRLGKVRHLTVREEGPAVVITSAEADKIYVPVYNPTVVYGEWQDREFPPVFVPPPQGFVVETIEPGIEVSVGYSIVRPLWGWSRPDWREQRIAINRTEYTRITRNVEVGPGDIWRHAGPVVLVAPTAVSRTMVNVNVPSGTVAPARAAAAVALPQRAVADPAQIKTQTTTAQPGTTQSAPGQANTAQPSTAQPGKTQETTAQPGATQPNAAQPGKAQSGTSQPEQNQTRTNQPSAAQPAQGQAATARPNTVQPRQGQASPAQPSEPQARHPEASRLNQEKGEAKSSEALGAREQERAKMPGAPQQLTAPQERAGSSNPAEPKQPATRAPEHNGAATTPGQHEQRARMPEQGGSSMSPREQHPVARAPERAAPQPPPGAQAPGAAAPEQHQQRRPGPEAGEGSSTPPAAAAPHAPPQVQRQPEPAGGLPPGRQEDKEKKEH
jgi:Protein of unknown function (DUF3300)